MKMPYQKFFLFCFFAFSVLKTQAQKEVLSAGNDALGSGGASSYSIGQICYTTNASSAGSSAQGVQHAYEILSVGNQNVDYSLSITTYPNPVTEMLVLEIKNYASESLNYIFYDLQGKAIDSKNITSAYTQINVSEIPSATYLLIIYNNNSIVQQFKVIKN